MKIGASGLATSLGPAVLLLALTGCASVEEKIERGTSQTQFDTLTCVTSPGALAQQPLSGQRNPRKHSRKAVETNLTLKLDRNNSQCLTLDGGRQVFAKLILLPEWQRDYRISFSSPEVQKALLFAPLVQTLDKEFKPTFQLSSEKFKYRGSFIRSTLFMTETRRNDRYLLVRSDLDVVGKSETRDDVDTNSIYIYQLGYLTFGKDADKTIHFLNNGRVTVSHDYYR